MDIDTNTDLIDRLLTRAGIIMEDASVAAILDDRMTSLAARVAAVRRAGAAIVVLADAANVILADQLSTAGQRD